MLKLLRVTNVGGDTARGCRVAVESVDPGIMAYRSRIPLTLEWYSEPAGELERDLRPDQSEYVILDSFDIAGGLSLEPWHWTEGVFGFDALIDSGQDFYTMTIAATCDGAPTTKVVLKLTPQDQPRHPLVDMEPE